MRPLLIAFAAVLLAPATASAAPFGELPFQTLADGASCVRATGAPGELVAWAPDGARFLQATPAGLTRTTNAILGQVGSCPVARAQPNGAGVVAAEVPGAIGVALREPGGPWGAPAKLIVPTTTDVRGLAAAISERGDAVVAWSEENYERGNFFTRVRVARRPAGGAFGAPQTLTASGSPSFSADVEAGAAADGTAIVLWSHTAGGPREFHAITDVAIAAPGAQLGSAQRLSASLGGAIALAVAPDGHALAAFSDDGRLRISERAPGGSFAPAQTLGTGSGSKLAVALGSGDEAFVAWGAEYDRSVTYARRTDASGFGPPIELIPEDLGSEDIFDTPGLGGSVEDISSGGGRPGDPEGGALRAVYAGSRVVLSWGDSRARGGLRWDAAHVATVAADDALATEVLSGPLRDAETVIPVILENGVPAVAWADNGRLDGRLHLAAEGATAAPAPAPRVHIGKPERSALRRRQALVLPVTCSAACDLRASMRRLTASASLSRAGTVRLRFSGDGYAAPLRAARVPVTVLSGAPGVRDVTTQVAHPRLRRIPDPPMPHILNLSAARDGSAVVVTWSTDHPARGVEFYVSPEAKSEGGGQVDSGLIIHGSNRRGYSARFAGLTAKARYVRVRAMRGDTTRSATVKIR